MVRAAGGKTHTTISHHDRGDPMTSRRLEGVFPGHLTVVVRVDIDESRSYQLTLRIDFLLSLSFKIADVRDQPTNDGDISFERRRT